ncbi:MAG: polyphosphate kinase 2 family protein [Myxococcales bacterium]|nr:polyphosphate kinase 2 family protein [Myxococcales bacterium]
MTEPHHLPKSPFLVPFSGGFSLSERSTRPQVNLSKSESKERLEDLGKEMDKLQRVLYASRRPPVLVVLQGMDAAGKDGTLRAVTRGLNPQGCPVYSFKAPTHLELEHDFMWRIVRRLPQRGRIGFFNRSHYEEVLAVRVHPEFLQAQGLEASPKDDSFWHGRFETIRSFEEHWARSGMVVLKFWLHLSKDEQTRRLLDRVDDPDSNWKFNARDVEERAHWPDYMRAAEEALAATSRPWAPWYCIPADDKPSMRVAVAETLLGTLRSLDLDYPTLSEQDRSTMEQLAVGLRSGKL